MNSIVNKNIDARGRVRRLATIPLALLALALGSVLATHSEPAQRLARDAELCPLDVRAIARRSVYLVDLRKPLDDAALPGRLLLRASRALGADEELEVFALTPFAEAPRMSLGRFCKPFADVDLVAPAAKHQRGEASDCADLPAQVSPTLRSDAQRYCELRTTTKQRIDDLAGRPKVAGAAPLVDAFAEISAGLHRDAAGDAMRDATLYVFSDMMQQASWYSHLDHAQAGWDFGEFLTRLERRYGALGLAEPPATNLQVKVFYLPREGLTAKPSARQAHKRFWHSYFDDRQVVFEDQTIMSNYPRGSAS